MPAKKNNLEDKPSEVAKVNAELDMQYGNLTYDELMNSQTVDVIPGWALIEDKEELRGVPFAVVRATFRPTALSTSEYVSVYAIAKNLGNIVFNDGSTGIRRQVLDYLIAKQIAVPNFEMTTADSPIGQFQWNLPALESLDKDGCAIIDIPFERPLATPRGLRVSEYDWENPDTGKTQKAKTYYLG